MKKVILCLVLFGTTAVSFGQQSEVAPERNSISGSDAFLARVRKQQKITLTTGIAGVALATTGGAMWLSGQEDGPAGSSRYNERNRKTGAALFYTGLGVAMVSSIFGEPTRKARKATKALPAMPYLKMERAKQVRSTGIETCAYPSLALHIKL